LLGKEKQKEYEKQIDRVLYQFDEKVEKKNKRKESDEKKQINENIEYY
jgi:hypothetical protein